METHNLFVAFAGSDRIARGNLAEVTRLVREFDLGDRTDILIFDARTARRVEADLRTFPAVSETRPMEEMEEPVPQRPDRPRPGVVPGEVTLLPRHWEWLDRQPGGASVALRRLVDEARKANAEKDRIREAQEAAYRFMATLAGNEPGFEEASRALFASNKERFAERIAAWPPDVRDFTMQLANPAFDNE
ncbi:MAG: DUF2239 family protein [Capsulimonadales bacterium]|nr:DUF2239 family protein [Capsulimonadales bacterium]